MEELSTSVEFTDTKHANNTALTTNSPPTIDLTLEDDDLDLDTADKTEHAPNNNDTCPASDHTSKSTLAHLQPSVAWIPLNFKFCTAVFAGVWDDFDDAAYDFNAVNYASWNSPGANAQVKYFATLVVSLLFSLFITAKL